MNLIYLWYKSGKDVWAPELLARRPDLNMAMVDKYLHDLYRVRPDFVYSVSRDFARSCQTPMLVMTANSTVAAGAITRRPQADPKSFLAARPRAAFPQFSALYFRATMRLINLPDDTLPTCSSSST
jgi:hypothetical protein